MYKAENVTIHRVLADAINAKNTAYRIVKEIDAVSKCFILRELPASKVVLMIVTDTTIDLADILDRLWNIGICVYAIEENDAPKVLTNKELERYTEWGYVAYVNSKLFILDYDNNTGGTVLRRAIVRG